MIKLTEKNGAITLAQKMMKGDAGGYYKPAVDDEGLLTWAASDEEMPAVEPANIMGPSGPQGENAVYVGSEEPTNPNILVWIEPKGQMTDYVMTETEVKDYIDDSLEEVEDGTY